MATKLIYPIIKTYGNLAMKTDKSVMSFYRVPNTPITITDKEKKRKHKLTVAQVMKKLAKNKLFEISLIPKDYLLEEKMNDFSNALSSDSQELGKEMLTDSVEKLTAEMEIPYQFDWLVGVNLFKDEQGVTVQELALERLSEVSELVAKGLGYQMEISEYWYEDFRINEANVYQTLSAFRAQRLTNEELFYYQRMQYLRYISHLKQEVIANRSLINVTDTLVKVMAGGFLKLESPYGSSFLTILPIAKIPTIFNGFHLGEFVQRFDFPVELRIKGEFMDKNSLKGRMGRSNIRYRNIMNEAESTDTVQQDEIVLGAMSLKDLMKKVGGKEEVIEYGAYLIVSGSSLSQLRRRRQVVLSYFEDMHVEVSEASHDTPYLFQSLLYGKTLENKTRTWIHYVTPRGFAELMPFTNTSSGNHIGWHIGRVDNWTGRWENIEKAQEASKNMVLFNATVGNKEGIAGKLTKNPHILITGATGEGKSFLAELIFILTSLQDVKCLYVDPKRSIRKHFEQLANNPNYQKDFPLLAKHIQKINFVTLDSKVKSNHGALDPIVMLDKDDAVSVSKNMLNYLIFSNKRIQVSMKQMTAISRAINKVVAQRQAGETVGLKHVLKELTNNPDSTIFEVGDYLTSIVENSILELAFSDGDVEGLSYDKRVTVLEVADLSLPDQNKKENQDVAPEDKEINSTALMFSLGAFCTRFGELNRFEDTIEFFDEAWVLMKSSEGRAVIQSMRRVGRYYNNVLCLITQSVHDAEGDDDTTGFGTLFAFKEDNRLVR